MNEWGPNVRLPPPLLYAVPFLAAWLLHRAVPLPIAPAGAEWLEALGIGFALVWFVIFAWAFGTLVAHGTTIRADRPVKVLVQTGPFAVSRNPLYLALASLYLGLTLLVNSLWPLFVLPLVIVAVQRWVIGREERYLAATFGERYDAYRRRVRRWL